MVGGKDYRRLLHYTGNRDPVTDPSPFATRRAMRLGEQIEDMTFDVIVIGSGQAGVPLATRLAGAGKRVLLAERGELGGTCINTGCTPTKTMLASARAAHVARTAGRLGVRAGPVEVDLGAVVDRKDAMVRKWREGVERRLRVDRLTVIQAHARFAGERQVEVGGEIHGAEIVV